MSAACATSCYVFNKEQRITELAAFNDKRVQRLFSMKAYRCAANAARIPLNFIRAFSRP